MGRVEPSPGRRALEAGDPACSRLHLRGMRGTCPRKHLPGGCFGPGDRQALRPAEPIDQLAQRFDYVLAEADGSKRLPLKAHAAWEPVIPAATANVVWVVGASGLGRPVAEVVHRPELFCERCGCEPTDIATPERVAQVLNAEMQALGLSTARVMLNQADTLADPTMADRFEAALNRPSSPPASRVANLGRGSFCYPVPKNHLPN